jgi:hypothetical protein
LAAGISSGKEMAIDVVARLQEKVPELKWGCGGDPRSCQK